MYADGAAYLDVVTGPLDPEVVVYSEEGSTDLAEQIGFGSIVESFEELLDRASVVDIVTPTYTHVTIATARREFSRLG